MLMVALGVQYESAKVLIEKVTWVTKSSGLSAWAFIISMFSNTALRKLSWNTGIPSNLEHGLKSVDIFLRRRQFQKEVLLTGYRLSTRYGS